MHIGADLRAAADGGPRIDHGVGTDASADVHVARHHDYATVKKRPVAGGGAWNNANARRSEVVLERNLVGEFERSEFDCGHL